MSKARLHTRLTDEECDEIRVDLAKSGDFASRSCIRQIHRMIEDNFIPTEVHEVAAVRLGYRGDMS